MIGKGNDHGFAGGAAEPASAVKLLDALFSAALGVI